MLTKLTISGSVFINSLLHSSNSSIIASNSSSLFKAVVAIMDGPPSTSLRRIERTDIDSDAGSMTAVSIGGTVLGFSTTTDGARLRTTTTRVACSRDRRRETRVRQPFCSRCHLIFTIIKKYTAVRDNTSARSYTHVLKIVFFLF